MAEISRFDTFCLELEKLGPSSYSRSMFLEHLTTAGFEPYSSTLEYHPNLGLLEHLLAVDESLMDETYQCLIRAGYISETDVPTRPYIPDNTVMLLISNIGERGENLGPKAFITLDQLLTFAENEFKRLVKCNLYNSGDYALNVLVPNSHYIAVDGDFTLLFEIAGQKKLICLDSDDYDLSCTQSHSKLFDSIKAKVRENTKLGGRSPPLGELRSPTPPS
jgi:hypothetical protein